MSHSLYTAVLAFWLVAGFQPTPASVVLHELRLTVVDVSGGVIVGATVMMDGADKDHRTGVTDARGQFAVGALGPGKYRVQVAAPGFAVFSTTVDVRQPVTTLDVTLQVAIAESVEVAMVSARLEAGTGLASTTLSGLALEALPEDPNTLLRHLNELAGTTGQPGELVISVDGFPQAVRLPPKQAIQLIRISSNPFAAEFADLGRARVDVVTKPGSSQVHADLRGSMNSAAMNARNRFATDRPDEKTQNVSGYVSGPIVPNRWSFVGYGGHWRSDDTQVVSATVLDPVDLEAAPLSLNVPSSSRVFNVWLGTDARIGTTNTLAMSGSTIDERADNQGLESGLDLPERAYRHRSNSRDLRLTLTSLGGPRVFNEVRIQATSGRTRSQAIDERPAIVVFDAFNGGGQQTALFAERQQSRLHLAERLTMSAARHTLKFGFDVERLSYLERDRSNFGGTFVFGADMERDAAGAPVLGDGDVPIAIAPLENYRRTLLGLPGYGPSQFSIAQGSEAVSAWQWQYGAFAQDDWAVHPRFTLSYGVRHEWETDVPGASVGARAAIAWAADEARRNTVRVGAGVFFQSVPAHLTLDVLRFANDHQRQILVDRPAFFPHVPADLTASGEALPTTYVKASTMSRPQTVRVAASLDRHLPAKGLLTISYDVQHGSSLLRSRNINAPDQGVRLQPARGPVLQYESSGHSRRHEVSVGWRSDPARRLNAFATYTFLMAESDTDGPGTLPADSTRLDAEFGRSSDLRAHQSRSGVSLTTPGDVLLSAFLTVLSGRPFNITTGFDGNADGVFTDRPVFAQVGEAGAFDTPYGWMRVDGVGDLVPRNLGSEPRQIRLDMHLSKAFRLSDRSVFHVGADVENVFNTPLYTAVNGVLTSPAFGTPNVAINPRRMLVSSGFSF